MAPWTMCMQGKDVHEYHVSGLRPFTEYEVRTCPCRRGLRGGP